MRFWIFALSVVLGYAQNGESLFREKCVLCHFVANRVNAPQPETLKKMRWQAVLDALAVGKMKGVGDAMSAPEREAVAKFVGNNDALTASAGRCAASPKAGGADWNGWSDPAGTRFQPARAAGLTKDSVQKLKLKWAFGFPGVTTAFGAPAIYRGRLLVGDANGVMYALDASSGCTLWTYTAMGGVRVAPVAAGNSVYFGDLRGNVYSVSLDKGALQWRVRAEEHPMAVITGSPMLAQGRLYVPVSGRDESIAATNPSYECCTLRGSVVALDAATGRKIWQGYTVTETPKPTGQNAKGAKTWGPSGAVPWSAPTVDLARHAVYIGTGVNYSQPTTSTSDAVVAFDMDTGKLLWSKQFTEADAYNFACVGQDKTNCPRDPFVDVDFGNSGVLRTIGGKRVLVIADKGGTIYGVDPDQQGKLLWKQKFATGGLNGGFMWGGAADEQGVAYFGISDFNSAKLEAGGGLVAFKMTTGEKLWLTPAPRPTCLGTPGCSPAQSAPVTVIPGVAFLGSWDGRIRAYDTKSGAIVWDFDTVKDFVSVNGVKARGGSINSMGPAVANGMLYITSGYSGTALPGNALLAFSLDGK